MTADDQFGSGTGAASDQTALEAPGANTNPEGSVHFRFVPTMAAYVRLNVALVRRSWGARLLAGFIVGSGLVTWRAGAVEGAAFILFGLLLASGYFVAPFLWFAIRRRRDLLLAAIDVSADTTGVTFARPTSTTTNAWSVYRRVRETRDAFLLDPGTGSSGFVLKRDADPAAIDRFRTLLEQAGFDLRPRGRGRPVLIAGAAFLVGMLIMPGFQYLPRVVATLGANAMISLSASVEGRAITLSGTTNLPDGSLIELRLFQLDNWNASQAAGSGSDPTTSPWVLSMEVTVKGGAFSALSLVPTWPSGKVVGVADFWMDSLQPPEALARYGPDGQSMNGPDVVDSDDGSRLLEVQLSFQLS